MSMRVKTSESHRITKACARCRRRKIRCDLGFPSCGACYQTKAECLGFDAVKGKERPRSDISHLESQVAQLEIRLATVKAQKQTTAFDTVSGTLKLLANRVVRATLQPQGVDGVGFLPLNSPIFLSEAPRPSFQNDAIGSLGAEDPARQGVDATTISSIPRRVVDILLNNYIDTYIAQYPFLEESKLLESCGKLYKQDPQISNFEHFIVAIALAISANTLARHDGTRATKASIGFWLTARKQLGHVGHDDPWQRLQALLLLAHYSFLDPSVINTSTCTSAATRLCLQLGLHRELPQPEQKRLGHAAVTTRRRLFWSTYSLDSSVRSILCQPFIWPDSSITTLYPTFSIPISAASHNWSLRSMEAEVTSTIYFPDLSTVTPSLFPGWFNTMLFRLSTWREQIYSQDNDNAGEKLADKIGFHELLYHFQIFRLNRLSPRCPISNHTMRRAALDAAIVVVGEFARGQSHGKFFYIWQVAHQLPELGLSILESALYGLETALGVIPTPPESSTSTASPASATSPISPALPASQSHLDGVDPVLLVNTVHTIATLLRYLAARWPSITPQVRVFDNLANPILPILDAWAAGNPILPDPQARKVLTKLLLPLCSLTIHEPAAQEPTPHNSINTPHTPSTLDILATASQQQHRASLAAAVPAAPALSTELNLAHVHPGIHLRDFLSIGSQLGAQYPAANSQVVQGRVNPRIPSQLSVQQDGGDSDTSSPASGSGMEGVVSPSASRSGSGMGNESVMENGSVMGNESAMGGAKSVTGTVDNLWELAGVDLEAVFSALMEGSRGEGPTWT